MSPIHCNIAIILTLVFSHSYTVFGYYRGTSLARVSVAVTSMHDERETYTVTAILVRAEAGSGGYRTRNFTGISVEPRVVAVGPGADATFNVVLEPQPAGRRALRRPPGFPASEG